MVCCRLIIVNTLCMKGIMIIVIICTEQYCLILVPLTCHPTLTLSLLLLLLLVLLYRLSFCWYISSPLFCYAFQVSLFIHKHSSTDCCTDFQQLYSEMFNAIFIQCAVLLSPTHRLTTAYIKYLGFRS